MLMVEARYMILEAWEKDGGRRGACLRGGRGETHGDGKVRKLAAKSGDSRKVARAPVSWADASRLQRRSGPWLCRGQSRQE